MGALTDLWKSERGLIAILLIIGATVLAGMAILSPDDWLDYTKWIFVTYAVAKTATGVTQIIKGGTADPEQSYAASERIADAEADKLEIARLKAILDKQGVVPQ